ncbi:MAG TPA: hypothetical protein RMH99_17695 [Sandaracinaceae bacterium LLY-WYZ-13_1]|nr:hypothetical protein [Sandaracinaceae bacterium LLY-WYZ-13_1]
MRGLLGSLFVGAVVVWAGRAVAQPAAAPASVEAAMADARAGRLRAARRGFEAVRARDGFLEDAPRCAHAHALLSLGDGDAARRALGFGAPEELEGEAGACLLAVWGRLARRRGDAIRAAAFFLRASRRAAADPPSVVSAARIRRWLAASPRWARRLAERAADGATGAAPSPAALCELVRATEELGGYWRPGHVACEVACRAGAHGVRAAVLRVRAERTLRLDEVRVAVRGPGGWSVVGPSDGVHTGHGMLGALRVEGCGIEDVDGAWSVVTRLRRWQGELDGACYVRQPRRVRHVCRPFDDGWRCHGWAVRGEPATRASIERGGGCPPGPVPGPWSVTLRFEDGEARVRRAEGDPPADVAATVGARSLAEAFGPR